MTNVTIDLIQKFQQLWRAGNIARLSLECRGGQGWANLHVKLPDSPPHLHQHGPHYPAPPAHSRRRPGPSRMRRRARRAEARKGAAEEAAVNVEPTEEVTIQAENIPLADAAAEAATAYIPPLLPSDVHQPAEEADKAQQQQHFEEVPEQGVPDARDAFCPDFEYKTAEQAEHARDQDVQQRHRQPHQEQERPTSGITLELFQKLAAENFRRLHF